MFSACLAHVAAILALLRKTLLVMVSFQLIFGCVFIYTKYSLFMIKNEYKKKCFHVFLFFFFLGGGGRVEKIKVHFKPMCITLRLKYPF